MVREILPIQHSLLHKKARPVVKADKKLLNLVKDLEDTLKGQKDPEGVGLCAPQIGVLSRVFVVHDKGKFLHFINPEIVWRSKKTNDPPSSGDYGETSPKKRKKESSYMMEGCLSLPNYYGPVSRAWSIKVKYQMLKLETDQEAFSGFVAQVIQHEIDHLNGITFVERLLEQNRNLFKLEKEKWVEVELP